MKKGIALSDQKTVFITGASSDIGLATCRVYATAGYRVIAHYRTMRPEFQGVLDAFDTVEAWHCDFTDTQALENALAGERAFFERADVLINLAASIPQVTFEHATAGDIMAALQTNLVPGLLLMQAMGPAMAQRGWGRIVQTSSIGVKFGGGQTSFAYALSKHAQEFIPAACRAWVADGVLTNVVRVGVANTRIHANVEGKDMKARERLIPAARAAEPEEIARTLYWLGSEENTYVSGQMIAASGGE